MKKDICPYCKKTLEKIECAKYAEKEGYEYDTHEMVTFLLSVASLFSSRCKQKLQEHKFKSVCLNKDCIGYLDGCGINKYNKTIWSYEFPKNKSAKERDEENS